MEKKMADIERKGTQAAPREWLESRVLRVAKAYSEAIDYWKNLPRETKLKFVTRSLVPTTLGIASAVAVWKFREGRIELPAVSPAEGKETTLDVSQIQIPPQPKIVVPPEAEEAPEYIERVAVPVERTALVYPGDTLIGIGKRLNIPWQEIAKLNNIEPPHTIYWSQKLIIPEKEESLGQYFEQRPSMTFEANTDFNVEERKWVNETGAKITEVFTNIVGPSFKTGIAPVKRGEPGEFHTEAWCYGSSEEYPAGQIRFRNDYTPSESTRNYAHEMSHLWLAGWEAEMVKVFSDIGSSNPAHVFVDALASLADYYLGESTSAEGEIFAQAYWRDPDFYLKLRKRFEEEGKPADVSQEEWQEWAEEASPGFNAWLEMVKEGPEIELPELTGRTFAWSERAVELAENNPLPIAFYLDWMAGPVEWFMPWRGTAKGASKRIGENKYLVYKVIAKGIPYPEMGSEGSLPYYNLEDSFKNQPLGEWK